MDAQSPVRIEGAFRHCPPPEEPALLPEIEQLVSVAEEEEEAIPPPEEPVLLPENEQLVRVGEEAARLKTPPP